MSKKTLEGQLDLFELFDSVEELEQTLRKRPEGEKTKAGSEDAQKQISGAGSMQHCFVRDGDRAVVAYLNYRKVYLKEWQKEPVVYQFEDNGTAIDFYVEALQRLKKDGGGKEITEPLELVDAPLINWKGGSQ
jgi:hypothetical protein